VNRFPTWKYALIGLVIAAAFLYTLPNFYGESPAVQVSSAKTTVKVDNALFSRVEQTLKAAGIRYERIQMDPIGVKIRFAARKQIYPQSGPEIRAHRVAGNRSRSERSRSVWDPRRLEWPGGRRFRFIHR